MNITNKLVAVSLSLLATLGAAESDKDTVKVEVVEVEKQVPTKDGTPWLKSWVERVQGLDEHKGKVCDFAKGTGVAYGRPSIALFWLLTGLAGFTQTFKFRGLFQKSAIDPIIALLTLADFAGTFTFTGSYLSLIRGGLVGWKALSIALPLAIIAHVVAKWALKGFRKKRLKEGVKATWWGLKQAPRREGSFALQALPFIIGAIIITLAHFKMGAVKGRIGAAASHVKDGYGKLSNDLQPL